MPEQVRGLIPSGAGTVLFEALDASVQDDVVDAVKEQVTLLRRRIRAGTSSLTTPDYLGNGHFMRFGSRFYSGIGPPAPRCENIEELNPEFADTAEKEGLCTP